MTKFQILQDPTPNPLTLMLLSPKIQGDNQLPPLSLGILLGHMELKSDTNIHLNTQINSIHDKDTHLSIRPPKTAHISNPKEKT